MKTLPHPALVALYDKYLADSRIPGLVLKWKNDSTGPRPYFLLGEDATHSAWLFGWRPGEQVVDHHVDATPIHGHGDSAALVCVLEGEVDNDDYGSLPRNDYRWPAFMESKILKAGQHLFLPVGDVHDMRCDEIEGREFSVTLHVYSPRLVAMEYYKVVDGMIYPAGTWHE